MIAYIKNMNRQDNQNVQIRANIYATGGCTKH